MDIDTDFEFLRKDDVLKEEAEDYGYDCFAKIETFGTMKAKNVLKGCAKVSGIENHVAIGNKLAKFILDDKQTLKTFGHMSIVTQDLKKSGKSL